LLLTMTGEENVSAFFDEKLSRQILFLWCHRLRRPLFLATCP
jgi:hypothetical protein